MHAVSQVYAAPSTPILQICACAKAFPIVLSINVYSKYNIKCWAFPYVAEEIIFHPTILDV